MGKNRKDSNKIIPHKTKPFPFKAKNQKQQNQKNVGKPKPQRPQHQKQNKSAEIMQTKKQAEQAEKERRIMEFKKKRLAKTKIISKKTSKGQPLMKDRIEYLLKQIQESKKTLNLNYNKVKLK